MTESPSPERPDDCPSAEQLFAFNVGELPGDRREAIAGHVEGCAKCLDVLRTLDDNADSVIATARKPVPPELFSGSASPPSLAATIAKGPRPSGPAQPERLGDYRIESVLGSGGMGIVYLAVHMRLGKEVALKVLKLGDDHDPKVISRFQREMEAVGRLDHPNVVRAIDAREEGGVHLLVMEYLKGSDLARIVEHCGPLLVADACEVIRQAALGLQYAHQGCQLVHRDLKPSNLMVTPDGVVKILDLGLARVFREHSPERQAKDASLTTEHGVMGTVDYMAPEQWDDSHAVDPRADLYSLGCTLYYALTGAPPFSGPEYETRSRKMMGHALAPMPPLHRKRPDIPDDLSAIVERMLAKKPENRYATATQVAVELQPFARGCDLPTLVARKDTSLVFPCGPAVPEVVPTAKCFLPVPNQRSIIRSRITLCALATVFVSLTLALVWERLFARPEPVALKEMSIYVWRGDDRDGLPYRRKLVANGQDLEVEPIRPPLGRSDYFQLAGSFARPALWYLVWFDTRGQVAVVESSDGPQAEVEYPRGESVNVNPDDLPGVHALVLMGSSDSSNLSAELLERQLQGIGQPPTPLPARWATSLRGPGGRKPAPSNLYTSKYLELIKDRMPPGLHLVYILFLETRK
jgi:serine/threonine protein kinase